MQNTQQNITHLENNSNMVALVAQIKIAVVQYILDKLIQ